MKIYDIISESRLTEAPGSPVIAEFINGMLKGMAWTLGRGSRTKAAEELARVWAKEMMENTKAPGKVVSFKPDQIEKILADAKLDVKLAADEAVKKEGYMAARKIYVEAENKGLLKDVIQGVKNVSNTVGKYTNFIVETGKWAARVYALYGATQPWAEYTSIIEEAAEQVKKGELTEQEFEKLARQEFIIMIGKLAVILPTLGSYVVGKVIFKSIEVGWKAALISKLGKTGPWAATFTNLVKAATPAALAALYHFINTPTGGALFAYWLTSAGGTAIGKGVEDMFELGSKSAEFIKQYESILQPGASSNTPAQSERPAQSGQQTSPSVGNTPSGATVSGDWK
jgi:hypothetical protein